MNSVISKIETQSAQQQQQWCWYNIIYVTFTREILKEIQVLTWFFKKKCIKNYQELRILEFRMIFSHLLQ